MCCFSSHRYGIKSQNFLSKQANPDYSIRPKSTLHVYLHIHTVPPHLSTKAGHPQVPLSIGDHAIAKQTYSRFIELSKLSINDGDFAVTSSNPPCMRTLFWNKFNKSRDTDRPFHSESFPPVMHITSLGILWGKFSSSIDVNFLAKLTTPDAGRASSTFSNLLLFSHLTLSKRKCAELNQILPTTTRHDPLQGQQNFAADRSQKT